MWYWCSIAVAALLADFAVACFIGLCIYRLGGSGEETVNFEPGKATDKSAKPDQWFASRF